MWTIEYRPGYYIQGYVDKSEYQALHSPTGHGMDWKKKCKSLHAAKIAITNTSMETKNEPH